MGVPWLEFVPTQKFFPNFPIAIYPGNPGIACVPPSNPGLFSSTAVSVLAFPIPFEFVLAQSLLWAVLSLFFLLGRLTQTEF